jgi:hypothetical protein
MKTLSLLFILIVFTLFSNSCFNRNSQKTSGQNQQNDPKEEGGTLPPDPEDENDAQVNTFDKTESNSENPEISSKTDVIQAESKNPIKSNNRDTQKIVPLKSEKNRIDSPVKPLTVKTAKLSSASKPTGKPGVKLITKIGDFSFKNRPVHHSDYVANKGIYFIAVKPKIFNIKTKKTTYLTSLKTLVSSWYGKSLVYYDAKKGVAGLLLTKRILSISKKNYPKCPCGGKTIFLAYMKKYYCPRCKFFLPSSGNIPTESVEQHYAHVNLKTNRILWSVKIADFRLGFVGVDEKGESLIFNKSTSGWKKNEKVKTSLISLFRVNILKRKVDWTYSFKMATRYRKNSSFHNISFYPSKNLKKIFIWEYDEKDKRHPKGYLKNPGARGYIVNVKKKKHLTISAPLTSYGYVFDKNCSFLYIGSYQLGNIYKIDTKTGKTVKKIHARRGTFKLIMSKTDKYMYAFNKTGIKVLDISTMKLVKTIPLSKLFPRINKLLSVERILPLNSGLFLMKNVKSLRVPGYGSSSGSKESILFLAQE